LCALHTILLLQQHSLTVAESNVYGLKLNTVNDTAAAAYWTKSVVKCTAADTRLIKPKDNIYVASFMVPAKAKYDAKLPGGWKYLEKESFLQVLSRNLIQFQTILLDFLTRDLLHICE
jgi:hypothetical protein